MNDPQSTPYRAHSVDNRYKSGSGGLILLGIGLIVVVNLLATEMTAARFNFAAALGHPLLHLGKVAIYQPFSWIGWTLRFASTNIASVRTSILTGDAFAAVGSFLVGGILWSMSKRRNRDVMAGNEDLMGSARFATKADLDESGVLATHRGVYIGGFREGNHLSYLMHDGKEHVLALAPTRSGKGVGIVIPTLLAWPESTIVYDIKGENWARTAGFRSTRLDQTCLKFSPLEENGSRFNPFDTIRLETPREIADVQNIATMLIDTGESDAENRYFVDEAISLVVGMILHLMYERRLAGEPAPSPADLLALLTSPEADFQEILARIARTPHRTADSPHFDGELASSPMTHPTVASKVRGMLNKADKEFSSVLSSAIRPLAVFADPLVRQATISSDFRIEDLVNGPTPTSLYLVIPPSDKERLRPLVRLMFTMIVNRLTEKMDFEAGAQKQSAHRLLFLIDEFPSLGRMPIFADALSYMAGYGLKALLITQDIRQVEDIYGQNEGIVSNCQVRIAYAPNNFQTAELLSRMTGTQTIKRANVNYSGERKSFSSPKEMSTSFDYVERALMTPDEVSRLKGPEKTTVDGVEKITGPGEMLIFISGQRPIFGTQILYFNDPELLKRSQIPPPVFARREPAPDTFASTLPPPIVPAPRTPVVGSDEVLSQESRLPVAVADRVYTNPAIAAFAKVGAPEPVAQSPRPPVDHNLLSQD